MIKIYAPIKLN